MPSTKPMIQRVSGMTKKKSTCPNFSGFSAIIPIPAAPIPCCALPVPIRPPAIAIAAAIANNGFVSPSFAEVEGSAANAWVDDNVNPARTNPAIIAIRDNFEPLYRIIIS